MKAGRKPLPLAAKMRFEVAESGCWIWTGTRLSAGYGVIRHEGKLVRAHRVSWEMNRGPIPEGKRVLHRCDVPFCVNPAHLFLGTQADNVSDMIAKGRENFGHKKEITSLARIARRAVYN